MQYNLKGYIIKTIYLHGYIIKWLTIRAGEVGYLIAMPKGIYDHKKNFKLTPKRLENLLKNGFKKGHISYNGFLGHNHTELVKENLSELMKGKKHALGKHWKMSDEHKRKISESNKGDKHWNWKANNAGKISIHIWLVTYFGNPPFCEVCGKIGEKIKKDWNIDWANKDHSYKRDINEYAGLCSRCHWIYDH